MTLITTRRTVRALPLPDTAAAPRTLGITVADADHLRTLADHHFPRSSSPVAALHTALDAAETARTITVHVTELDAAALRNAGRQVAPDQIADATTFLMSQLPRTWPDEDTVPVLSTVGHARALHAHHSALPQTRRTTSRTIRRLLARADYTSRDLTVTVPWDAAHIIDTLHALHPTDRLLRRLSPNR